MSTGLARILHRRPPAPQSDLAARYFAQGKIADFDATKLTGLSDTDPISSWTDALGAYTGTQSGSNRPTYSATGWSNGGPCVSFARASKQGLEIDAMAGLPSSPVSCAMLLRRSSLAATSILAGWSNGATSYRYHVLTYDYYSDGSALVVDLPSGGVGIPFTSSPVGGRRHTQPFSDEDTLVIFTSGGTNTRVYVNGQMGYGTGPGSVSSFTKFVLGGLIYNAALHPSAFDGSLRRALFWNRELAIHDMAAIARAMRCESLLRWGMIVLGDSVSTGAVSGVAWCDSSHQSYPNTMIETNPTSGDTGFITARGSGALHNFATNGRALVNDTNYSSAGNNEYDTIGIHVTQWTQTDYPYVVVVFLGSNDLAHAPAYYGSPAAVVEGYYWQVVDAVRAANPLAYIVAVTPLNRSDYASFSDYVGSDAPYNAEWADFCARIRANWASHADALWDANAIPQMADPTNMTYFADGAHPTAAGQAALAAAFPLATYQAAAIAKMVTAQLHT